MNASSSFSEACLFLSQFLVNGNLMEDPAEGLALEHECQVIFTQTLEGRIGWKSPDVSVPGLRWNGGQCDAAALKVAFLLELDN